MAARGVRVDEQTAARFRRLIRNAAAARDCTPIPTSTAEQAAIVLEVFFAKAQKHLLILSGALNPRIYGSDGVIVEAKKFLADSTRQLKILLLKDEDESIWDRHPLLDSLKHFNNITVDHAPLSSGEDIGFHFSVMDNDSYRIKRGSNGHSSIVGFGDYKFTSRLSEIFMTLYEHRASLKHLRAAS